MAKITSPRFEITKEDIPSIYKSALISMGGVVVAILFLLIVKSLLPNYDYTAIEIAVSTAVGAWLVNLVKIFIEQK